MREKEMEWWSNGNSKHPIFQHSNTPIMKEA
jgi:hypothetical protein